MKQQAGLLMLSVATLLAASPGTGFAQSGGFQLEEATISDIQGAIQKGERTCRQIVEA